MQTIDFCVTPRTGKEGASSPTSQTSLKAELEAARDAWVASTPQISDHRAADAAENITNVRQVLSSSNNPTDAHAKFAEAVKKHAEIIKTNSSTLDEHHAAAVSLMNAGIAAAVTAAGAEAFQGKPVRVTISGHRDKSDDGIHPRTPVRLLIAVDIAG
jgi:hypothetical protein